IWALGKLCYLPIVPQEPHNPLSFAPVVCDTSLEKNRFGVLEPVVPTQVLITAKQLDLIFLPLVGFDPEGNRLGMGSGFYDRSLAFLRDRTHRGNPHPVGLAHDFQHIDGFAVDPWDVPLEAVITDKYVYAFD
ncbi:MAG: 5-formyltetrahydrofolate cyclo-ligase, partial [Acidiferrobacterales bacterium]